MPQIKDDELNYTLYKFSKFISEEMIDNGQFIVIKKYNNNDGVNRRTYYIYPILEVLEEEDRETVKKDIENLMKSKKCPKSSIGYSTLICDNDTENQDKWADSIMDYEGEPYEEVEDLYNAYGFST